MKLDMEWGRQWQGKCCYAYGTSLTSATWGNYIPWLAELSGLNIISRGIPAEGITNLGGCSTGKIKEQSFLWKTEKPLRI